METAGAFWKCSAKVLATLEHAGLVARLATPRGEVTFRLWDTDTLAN